MLRHRTLIFLLLLAALAVSNSPAHAAAAVCAASPTAGPPGTVFTVDCSGFSANAVINTYVVEPDGRTVSGAMVFGFHSNLGGGSVLTDKDGHATFTWQSAGGGAAGFSVELGQWVWVAHELAPGGLIAGEGQAPLEVLGQAAPQSGAALSVSPAAGKAFNFSGAGFAPYELANVWVSMPPNCSGRSLAEGASAAEPSINGFFDGFDGPSTVKADKDGNIVFSLVFRPEACRGEYSATARALGSGRGGIASFVVTGDAVVSSASLTATPNSVNSIAPFLTLLGGGYPAGVTVSCWTTRPDGRAFGVGVAPVDSSGNFSLSIHASGFDSFWPFASEEPGVWYATCAAPSGGLTGVTSFMVTSLTSDP